MASSAIRSYLLDLSRWLSSGNLDSDSLDYLRFRLDWLLNVLQRYSGTENLNDVIDILRSAARLVSTFEENQAESFTAFRVFYTGNRGKPKIDIPKEHLEFFLDRRFSVQSIADLLGISKRTVERRLHQYNLSVRSGYTDINNDDLLDTVKTILTEFPQVGYRRMTGFLKAQGIIVQQQRIRSALQTADPEGTLVRALGLCTIQRRRYFVPGPLYLWHIDGNHKLIRYGLQIFLEIFDDLNLWGCPYI